MDRLKTIFNGHPDKASDNVLRGAFAVGIPTLTGFLGSAIESFIHPELGIIPLGITFLVPVVIGILEMTRQNGIMNKKNIAMDDRTLDRLLASFEKTDTYGLYSHKKNKK